MDAKAATTFLTTFPQAGTAFVPIGPAHKKGFYDPVTRQRGHSISALLERCERNNAVIAEEKAFKARQLDLNLA